MSDASPRQVPFAGAVLCGGASRRMGRDKSKLELDGVTLLRRSVARLGDAGATPILVVSRRGEVELPGSVSLADALTDRGPLGGLVAALRAIPTELCAVVAVDMPDLSPAVLRLLAGAWAGEQAVVPLGPRGVEPLHALYARSALMEAERRLASDDVSLRGLLTGLRVATVDVAAALDEATAASFAANLNRPEEVAEWLHRHRRAAPPPSD